MKLSVKDAYLKKMISKALIPTVSLKILKIKKKYEKLEYLISDEPKVCS